MKRILTILLSIIIFISIFLSLISYSSKEVVVNTVSTMYTKDKITKDIEEYIYDSLPTLTNTEKNRIQNKIMNSTQLNIITTKYLDGIINSILNNKKEEVDINEEVNTLVDSITLELNEYQRNIIKDQVKNINLNNVYEIALERIQNNINPSFKNVLNIYKVLDSNTFKNYVKIILAISMILVFIISKSFIKGFSILSKVFILFGVFSSILTFIINNSIQSLTTSFFGYPIVLDLSILFKFSLFVLVLGTFISIILLITQKIIEREKNSSS